MAELYRWRAARADVYGPSAQLSPRLQRREDKNWTTSDATTCDCDHKVRVKKTANKK